MQDRFKFRTYIPDLKFFKYWGWIEDNHYVGLCACGDYQMPELLEKYTNQCTGLKDKNGKLIYEGDILGGTYGNLDIFYCPQCMQFELHCKGYGCMSCNGDIHWCEVVEDNNELEVVGNIYENPELLED